ncbi:hypothetical protein [Rhizobium phage RHph_X3_2]|nr:hypothetical protein [Rhizobium phage RHph_X3_2]
MKYFAVYDDNGVILRHGKCPDATLELQGDNVLELLAEPPADLDLGHYVSEGSITQRPQFDIPDELELAVGESKDYAIPNPCKITFDGVEHVVTDGVLGIDGEMPAEYTLTLEQWPYLPHTLKVIVQ